jgi:hypothetical protein
VAPYLNRLSDLVWTMARWQEDGESLPSRTATAGTPPLATILDPATRDGGPDTTTTGDAR